MDGRWIALAVLCAAIGAGGCSSNAIPLAAREPFLLAPPVAPAPGPAERILSGFDLADDPGAWNIGDRVLLSVRQRKPDGVTVDRLLLIELLGEKSGQVMEFTAKGPGGSPYVLETPYAKTRLTLYDAEGTELKTAEGKFPEAMLSSGLYDGAEPAVGLPASADAMAGMTEAQYDRAMRGWLTTMSFSGSLGKPGMFQSMLKDVVARPPLLQILFRPTVALETGDAGITPGEAWAPSGHAGAPVPTVRVPLVLKIAGKAGMVGEVLAARPVAPLSLCGGIVTAEARNADRPEVRAEIRLLAARRGNGGQVLAPAKEEKESE